MDEKTARDAKLIETLPHAFARHRVVTGKNGKPVDYIFLQVNSAFEKMTGLNRNDIQGKKVTQVFPGIENEKFDWINNCGAIALEGGRLSFEVFFEPLQRWYEVQAYSDETGYFTTVFNEIKDSKVKVKTIHSLLKSTDSLLQSHLDDFNYQAVADMLQQLSGAKYTAINIYKENCSRVVTRAFSGAPSAVKRASELLGLNLKGYSWEVKPEFLNALEGGGLIRFKTLHQLTMGLIGDKKAELIQQTFKFGDIYLVELTQGENDNLGNIVFFMPPGKPIDNPNALEIYAVLLGLFLGKLRVQEEVKIQKERLSSIIDGANVGTYEWNVQTGETIYNERWADIIGYKLEELEPVSIKTWTKHVHPDDKVKSNESFYRHVDGEIDFYDAEVRMKHKDGQWVWVNERGKVGSWTDDGKPLWVFGFHIDITEKKVAADNLSRLNSALEQQVKERAVVDAFTYSVSNDLRAPLRRISGFGEALLEEYNDLLDEKGQDYLKRINSQTRHMDNLVISMLELSKISRHDILLEEVDLAVIFRAHLERLNMQQPDRVVQAVTASELVVNADLELMDTFIAILLDNSWKFSADKEKAIIEIGSEIQEGKQVFFIRDNGVGFDMRFAEKLFLPFQRLHIEDDYPGIGIGLNIAQRIISRHGGEIWAESEPGEGATIFFTFPQD